MTAEASVLSRSAKAAARSAPRCKSPPLLEPKLQPAALAPHLQRDAFDGCPDFSKLNSARHQGHRADTFHTPRPLTGVPHSAGRSETRPESARQPVAEMIHVFEMGVSRNIALLRSEIKDELKTSTDQICRDVMACIEDTRGLVMLETLLQKVDKILTGPVNVNFAEVFTEIKDSEVLLTDRIQGLERQNSQNTGKVLQEVAEVQKANREHHEQQERAREQVQELRNRQELQLDTHMQGAEARHCMLLEQHRTALSEVQRLQQDSAQHRGEVNERHASHAKENQELSEAFRRAHFDIKCIASLQETMNVTAEGTAEHARQLRQEGNAHRGCLEQHVSSQLEESVKRMDVGQIVRHTKMTNHTLEAEFSQVYCELSKIQQALHVDFVSILDLQVTQIRALTNKSKLQEIDMGPQLSVAPATRSMKQLRNCSTQTETVARADAAVMTTEKMPKTDAKDKKPKMDAKHRMSFAPDVSKANKKPPARIFADQEAVKEKARQAIIRPPYNVFNFYHATKVVSQIAMNPYFEYTTMAMILFNAIWLGVDADHNKASVIVEAEPLFQIVEHTFCLFFSLELAVRFLSFRRTIYCIRDFWFVFDSVLVFFMVAETWVMTAVILLLDSKGPTNLLGDASVLRMLRIVKMLRVSRMARLMRGFPEILVLLKGIKAAFRSVLVFFFMWLILVYVFALVFVTLADGSLDEFKSVPAAMNTLLLDAILPSHGPIVKLVSDASPIFWIVMMSFIAVASITLMNMLVGVLVEVVNMISSTEREGVEVMTLAQDLRSATAHLNIEWKNVSREQFQDVLSDGNVAQTMNSYGADPSAIVDAAQSHFEELERVEKTFGFEDFVELVLKMRGKNAAKVRDIKEQVGIIKRAMTASAENVIGELSEGFTQLRLDLRSVHEATMEKLVQEEEDEEEGVGVSFSISGR